MLIACTKMNPLSPQMLDLMSKTMRKLTKTVFRWPFSRLDTCDKSPLNPGNNKKAIFIATRDTVVLTLFSNFRIGADEMSTLQDLAVLTFAPTEVGRGK